MSLRNTATLKQAPLKQFFAPKRPVYRALPSSQLLLKRKLSVSARDKCIGKQLCSLNPYILTLPTEAIENIFLQVDQLDDLHSLTRVNRLFASIACPIYTKRHKIHVTVNSSIVHIRGDSFRALATWQRSRLFTNIRDKYLYCEINDDDHETAKTQLRALQKFLGAPFLGRLFNTVHISSADGLSPPEILQFIQLIDSAGCSSASISSGLSNPEWLASSLSHSPKRKLPIVSLSYLRSLHIDNQYFSPQQWSSLLPCLTGPDLEALVIRGQPTIHALSKFLSRHPRIEKLHFADRWATHAQCIRSSGTRNSLRLPMLSEIEGPPCHLQAILKCLSHAPSALTVKIASDFGMSYLQYVHAVLDLVSLCGPHTNLKIHLSRYHDDNELTLRQLKSLRNIKLPEVASLTISFPSMSKKSLLNCCTQWFMLIPMLRSVAVYVSPHRRRQESISSTDIVAGPLMGSVINISGKTEVEWDVELE